MDRWPGSAMKSALLREHREDPLLRTQPVDAVLTGDDAVGGQFVGDEPVPEFRIAGVDIECGVDQMGIVPVPSGHGIGVPLVERLPGESQHPAGHRDGDTVGSKFTDQREHHFVPLCCSSSS